jgi:hypothetical protein
VKCPHCSNEKHWILGDGRYKCSKCRKAFSGAKKRVRISQSILKKVVKEFAQEHSTNVILERVDISRYMLLRVLTLLREAMSQDIPRIFKGIVEDDETHVAGEQRKPVKLHVLKDSKPKRRKGTISQAVFGILCRGFEVWADLIEGAKAKDFRIEILKQTGQIPIPARHRRRFYTGIASMEFLYRLDYLGKNKHADSEVSQIICLESFWNYLEIKLPAKRGVREDHLHLYLGEYVWRYNHRGMDSEEQERRLRFLLRRYIWSG